VSEVPYFRLQIDGKPQGKPRARFATGHKPYPDRKQALAEGEVRRVWQAAGSPRLPDDPLSMVLLLGVSRPAAHWRTNGELSTEGLRNPWPHRSKPDCDNAIKLVCDSLNALAWRDDVRFVDIRCLRVWTDWPSTVVEVAVVTHAPPTMLALAA
jgi:Holliday junction resolvase RusA-like endonuclease